VAGRRAARARPTRPRSRHFLRPAVAAELVRDACLGPGDLVVDIGAGSGRLTAELARVARRVVAVELDPALAARLRGRWPNVDVVEGDAARMRPPREPFRVVANLPFSRTNDLLRLLLDRPETPLLRADLVVEWGVAVKRGLPWPSTVNGVVWGATYETSVARRLPRESFEPPPSVDAAVLVVRRRPEPLVPPQLLDRYGAFVARGFRHGLRAVAPARGLPRDLDAHAWAALFHRAGMMDAWAPRRSSSRSSSRSSARSR
jgi:23S rRNA (adenine-N6)-dimethyltransferase